MKFGLVYGSTTGNTEDAAELIREHLKPHISELLRIEDLELEELPKFDILLIGIPTWDVGGLQDDWEYAFDKMTDLSFAGTQVAFFGQGDQHGYPENFQDAMGILRNRLLELGAQAEIGHTSRESYEFTESVALLEDKLVGLALDEDNQSELTEDRIESWCEQLKSELKL